MDASETTIYTTILIVAITIGSIILYLVISLIRQHRNRLKLYQSKINAEITTLEKERTRMAADLHDELGPILSAAKFKLASLELSNHDEKMRTEVEQHIDTIITRMRDISKDLMPITLIRKGPVFAIEEFIYTNVSPGQLCVQFSPAPIPTLPEQQAIHLYRIVQEIIHNTIKHAAASSLMIRLTHHDNILVISSEDDGKGFDLRSISRQNSGRGLQHMLSRTEMLHGAMYLESAPGKGTKITIEFPFS